MERKKQKKIYVIGHRNPDTDSICSAIAYAELKCRVTGRAYTPRRAGQLNEETQYVLKRFGVKAPPFLSTVRAEVQDVDIHRVKGVSASDSLKTAWERMGDENARTLPVLNEDNRLEGVITITDITRSYMDAHDANLLAKARTKYYHIAQTLGGEIVLGNSHGFFQNGKVVIAASSPDAMEEFISQDDLVIMGNRYETQLCAIMLGASCLVLCQGAKPSRTILELAGERNCVIISTPHDTFSVAQLINQSIPVKYFMTEDHLVTFHTTDWVEDIQDIMTKNRFRNFPVVDQQGRFAGLISRRRLMNIRRKRLVLVDHNEKTQAVDGIEQAEVLEIIDHHRLGGFETVGPVYFRNQPVGCTATIIAEMYDEEEEEITPQIAGLLCSAILSDTLMFRSPTCTKKDQEMCGRLAKLAGVDPEELAREMFKAGSNLSKKSAQEICAQDFKTFSVSGVNLGIGQINSMDADELAQIRKKTQPYLETLQKDQSLDMVFLMLTNIVDESTELICSGADARPLIREIFDIGEEAEHVVLKGVVSRKKQLLPVLVEALQQ